MSWNKKIGQLKHDSCWFDRCQLGMLNARHPARTHSIQSLMQGYNPGLDTVFVWLRARFGSGVPIQVIRLRLNARPRCDTRSQYQIRCGVVQFSSRPRRRILGRAAVSKECRTLQRHLPETEKFYAWRLEWSLSVCKRHLAGLLFYEHHTLHLPLKTGFLFSPKALSASVLS